MPSERRSRSGRAERRTGGSDATAADQGEPAAPPRSDGRRTRWEAHRAERRTQVVEAALEVLADIGPDFGLDQVAERAGVTKPVIYRHFDDRAGLIAAMGERATATLLHERILPALAAGHTPWARIRASVDAFLGFLTDHPNIYWIFVRHGVSDGNRVAQTNKDLIAAAVAAVLGDFLRAGMGDAGVAEVWAHGLVGFVQNTAEWWLERPTMNRDALTEYVTVLIWAQFAGIARWHGLELHPDEPLEPADLARRVREGGSRPRGEASAG